MDEKALLEERKKKVVNFLKKSDWIIYAALAIVTFIAVKIRLLPTAINPSTGKPGLWDITTNNWTLGPDLDPFLFLRWAKDIVQHGSLAAIDFMRNVPLGFNTKDELILLPHMIAWFHNIASFFGSNSVEQSAALFPVFMFALTVPAFFLLVRAIFKEQLGKKYAGIIAVISSFFISVIPSFLPRAIAGVPEKEGTGFIFLFLAFYFFISSWKSKNTLKQYSLSILAGISTGLMALIWGGYQYIVITIALSMFISFILGQVTKNKIYIYSLWILSSVFVMAPFSTRYTFGNIIASQVWQVALFSLGVSVINFVLFETRIKNYLGNNLFKKIPEQLISLVFVVVAGFIVVLIFGGPRYIVETLGNIISNLIVPITNRFGVTVAENRQPYFGEWAGSFGPSILGTPLFFWIFFAGSVFLFVKAIDMMKIKERMILGLGYFIFLSSIIFSRYSSTSLLNGENTISLIVYFGGIFVFLGAFCFYYYKYYLSNGRNIFLKIDFGFILLLSFFFFSVVSARGAVRLILVLVPSSSILASYLAVILYKEYRKLPPESSRKMFVGGSAIVVSLALIFAGYQFYNVSKFTAQSYVPSIYNQQWQKAMSWVRENTPENAVFGHWWDYGYWVQTIGERATVLDGGNQIVYWDYLMGRYALTNSNESESLEFLYSHNTTHFLIDSSDIGKYTAFSSIGSNENYDRRSWISTFLRDNSRSYETKNKTNYLYTGGFSLDDDIVYYENGTKIFLPGVGSRDLQNPGSIAGLGGIQTAVDDLGVISQPEGIFIYQNKQYSIPLRYAYYNKTLIDFGSGIDAGIFFMPRISLQGQQVSIEPDGVLLYLSARTIHSNFARLYLFNQENDHFKLTHTEDDFLISSLKSQGVNISDFAYYDSIHGPIKIWEISYPPGIKVDEKYLEKDYPNENLVKV